MSSSFALSSCTKRLRLDQPHRTASHCNALHCNGAGIKSSLCCEEEESLQVYVLQKASKRSRILPLDISSENAESRRCASVDRIDIPHHRKSCILYSVSGEVPMSLLDETAGSPEAGPSNTAGRVGAIPQAKTRVKKRARRSQKTDAVDAVDPAAASPSHAAYAAPASEVRRYSHGKPVSAKTKNKKLATHLSTLAKQQKASALAAYEHDSLLLPQDLSSRLQAENDLERTWRVSQADIKDAVGTASAQKGFSLSLPEFGPYELDYSTDGRSLAIAGRRGHVATFDWQTGKLGAEMHLNETVRDICWLHNTSFFAVAQKKYAYIYDSNGLEIHQLRSHLEINRMQFLKYHFLLATVGNAGYLKYQDTSTGSLIAEHRTRLGPCQTMAQNHHSGVISLGHSNGTVTMWTPNISTAQIQLLAHKGPVCAIAHDPSTMGSYFATAGLDGTMKVWDSRTWGVVNEWHLPRPASSLSYSQKGLLAAGWGNHATIYADTIRAASRAPGPYMSQLFPSTATHDVQFCPFEDILGVGHARGFTSLIVPGAGEGSFDSLEADPFESKKARREREVVSLLDKLQPDQIHLDADFIGKLAPKSHEQTASDSLSWKKVKTDFAQLSRIQRLDATGQREDGDQSDSDKSDPVTQASTDDKAVKKPRGRNKVLKRILRRKKNVIDEKTMRVRELIDQRRRDALDRRVQEQRNKLHKDGSALDRFA